MIRLQSLRCCLLVLGCSKFLCGEASIRSASDPDCTFCSDDNGVAGNVLLQLGSGLDIQDIPTAAQGSEATSSAHCQDTPGWTGLEGSNCNEWIAIACRDRRPLAFWGGGNFNFPENNCCLCGKGETSAATALAEATSMSLAQGSQPSSVDAVRTASPTHPSTARSAANAPSVADGDVQNRLQDDEQELNEREELVVLLQEESPTAEQEEISAARDPNATIAAPCLNGTKEQVVYGPKRGQSASMCFETTVNEGNDASRRPVILFVFSTIQKRLRQELTHKGQDFVYMTLNYETRNDIATAVGWVIRKDVSARYRIDPDRVVLMGYSEGGIAVQGAAKMLGRSGGVHSVIILNGAVRENEVRSTADTPLLLILQGDQDPGFLKTSMLMKEDLEQLQAPVSYMLLPGVNHVNWRLRGRLVYDAMTTFLMRYVVQQQDSTSREGKTKLAVKAAQRVAASKNKANHRSKPCSSDCREAYTNCINLVGNQFANVEFCNKMLHSTPEWKKLACTECKLGLSLVGVVKPRI